jgi:KaiC/GvpD/RAD55 family RecA-like ATPase
MDKVTFLNKVKEIIGRSDYKSLQEDYDDGTNIEFKDDSSVTCIIRLRRRLFGVVSDITLRRDYVEVLRFKLTKDEYREIRNNIKSRLNEIREKELSLVFKDITRDNSIKSVLD